MLNQTQNILDIGTGTGLLSLMITQKNQEVAIDAIEIDIPAAIQARQNVSSSAWNKRINVIEADVTTFGFPRLYDSIISNPPFYENELASPDPQKNIAHHDEGLVLDELLFIIKNNLKKNGKFFILSSYKREEELKKLFAKHELFVEEKIFVRQAVNLPITRSIIAGSTNATGKIKTSEISIRKNKQLYTTEFINLLKDYYLNL